jgi:hypothetical protein
MFSKQKEMELDLENRRLLLREKEIALREKELIANEAQRVHEEKMKQLEHERHFELLNHNPYLSIKKRCIEPAIQRKRPDKIEPPNKFTIIKPGWNKANPKTQEEALGLLLDHCLIPSTLLTDTIEIDSVIHLVKQAALKNLMNWRIPEDLFNKMANKLQTMEKREFIDPILQARATFNKCRLLQNHPKSKYLDNDMVVKQRPSHYRSTCLTHVVVDPDVIQQITTCE